MDLPTRPHENCYWLAPRLLAGEYPGAITRADALPRLRAILDAGVTFFLDLTEPGELAPYAALLAEAAGARRPAPHYRRMPVRDLDVPPPGQMAAILDSLDEALAEGETVYLHCWGGIGRTGTVAGCWLVRHGASGSAALVTVAERFATVGKAYRVPRSPETDEQVAYILGWKQPGAAGPGP
jgi:hypothetical protein